MARQLPRALKPLRHEAYRWLFGTLVVSMLGAGLLIVALVWQVVELGGGPTALSAVTSASAVGMLVTTLLGGALADRIPQKRILLGVELAQGTAIGVIALLSLAGLLDIWHLSVVSLITGLAAGLYYPAYSALLPSLMPAEDLLAANGLEGVLRPDARPGGRAGRGGRVDRALVAGPRAAGGRRRGVRRRPAGGGPAGHAGPSRARPSPARTRSPTCSPTSARASST